MSRGAVCLNWARTVLWGGTGRKAGPYPDLHRLYATDIYSVQLLRRRSMQLDN